MYILRSANLNAEYRRKLRKPPLRVPTRAKVQLAKIKVIQPRIPTRPEGVTVEDNLGLAYKVALHFCRPGEKAEDTEQYSDALMGLWMATRRWNPLKGAFSTYAEDCIWGQVIRGHRFRTAKKRSMRVLDIDTISPSVFEAEPEPERLPAELVEEFLAPRSDDTAADRRAKKILFQHYIRQQPWSEIARQRGVSRAAVQQMGRNAINKIRQQYAALIRRQVEEN